MAPLAAALAVLTTVFLDSALTLSEAAWVVALSSIEALVTVVSTVTATVPPTAAGWLAVMSATVVASTVFLADSSSAASVVTEDDPPTFTVAVLLMVLMATAASAGSARPRPVGLTLDVTVDSALSVALPVELSTDVPATFTVALELATLMASGVSPSGLVSTEALAPIASVPLAETAVSVRLIEAVALGIASGSGTSAPVSS